MRINLDRMIGILGPAPRPKNVWEKQFDGDDNGLAALASTDWRNIQGQDLWPYLLDLAYVEIQPDLFRYLFPACLKFWYESLMCGKTAEAGDTEFHYALIHGDIMRKMLTPNERLAVNDFFRDGFLDYVDSFPSSLRSTAYSDTYAWIRRLNSLGLIAPVIPSIWEEWWALDSPGKALCVLIYASAIVYEHEDNPVSSSLFSESFAYSPPLTEDDSQVHDRGWLAENLDFLRLTLTAEYIQQKLADCQFVLSSHPAAQVAYRALNDSKLRTEFIDFRLKLLIDSLGKDCLERNEWD